jgi:hypothetical protein
MATLVYSDRCQYSAQVIRFIQENPALLHVVRFHNVTTQGVPSKQITRVPTIVTNENKILVGNEVKSWLESMVASNNDFEPVEAFGPAASMLDGTDNEVGSFFDLNSYGSSLAPPMTRELEERINRKVQDAVSAYQNLK